MTPLTIRELEPDAGTRRFAVRMWESENVLTEEQLRALRDAADAALKLADNAASHTPMFGDAPDTCKVCGKFDTYWPYYECEAIS